MRLSRLARLVSILRDITIIAAVFFACIAVYKFMVYFAVWNALPYE